MFILGLTGGIACGKSTVARIFKSLGAEVIDADEIAHKMMGVGTKVWERTVDYFGKGILNEDSSINRAGLGKIVFASARKCQKLEEITHPPIIKAIRKKIKKLLTSGYPQSRSLQLSRQASLSLRIEAGLSAQTPIIVIDVPLLIEADLTFLVDKLMVVSAGRRTQIRRLKESGLQGSEAEKRIDSQIPLKKKIKLADYVIKNNGSLRETERQVKRIWKEIAGK